MPIIKMTDLDLHNKRVLIREDLNVPIQDGKITSNTRIEAVIPTLQIALRQRAKVMILSHLGRPMEGKNDNEFSLALVAKRLEELLGQPVRLIKHWLDGINLEPGEIVLCENVRFLVGENKNDSTLAKKMAALCDVFVMDAFATAHRAQASTYGVAEYAPIVCAGPLLVAELEALAKVLQNPARPMIAIVGGSKVSTKIEILTTLIDRVNQLIVGGGIANTFIAACGLPVGKSLYEPEFIPEAKRLITLAKERGSEIPIPTDVVVAKTLAKDAVAILKNVDEVAADEMILDIGPETAARFAEILKQAGTILWNGPVGVFEYDAFEQGTKALAKAIAASKAFSIAGGGDTLAAIDKYGVVDKISYISTGGGAFLEFLEGKKLPAVEILEKRGN